MTISRKKKLLIMPILISKHDIIVFKSKKSFKKNNINKNETKTKITKLISQGSRGISPYLTHASPLLSSSIDSGINCNTKLEEPESIDTPNLNVTKFLIKKIHSICQDRKK